MIHVPFFVLIRKHILKRLLIKKKIKRLRMIMIRILLVPNI